MTDHGLSTQQLAVICALSSGATMTAAAEEAGVHRNTITNWLRNLLPFQQALNNAQYTRALFFREKMEDLVDLAAKAIHDLLVDPKTPASVHLKAALAVLQTASTPPLPKKQVLLEIEKIVIQPNVGRTPTPSSASAPQVASPEIPKNLHKDAQPTPDVCGHSSPFAADSSKTLHNVAQSPRHKAPKIGRNDACPCGSGLKYKRCCLDKVHSKAA